MQERCRVGKGIVDMGLGGEVHDRVGGRVELGDQLGEQRRVGDVSLDQADLVLYGASDSWLPA